MKNLRDFYPSSNDLGAAEFENELCAYMGVMKSREDYLVTSSTGTKKYRVSFAGSPEWMTPEVNTWECTCPAGEHGKSCWHIGLVAAISNFVCDEFGLGD